MPNYAVIENNVVINTMIADNKNIAEQITEKTCVEFDESNVAHIGLSYLNNNFEQPEPIIIEIEDPMLSEEESKTFIFT